jgi:hypothetical protein
MAEPAVKHLIYSVRTRCPDCDAELSVLSVINGRCGSEYWALQCIACHGVHLDIVEQPTRH